MRSRADLGWRLFAIAALGVVLAACNGASAEPDVVRVPADYATVSEAVDAAPDGATIRLAPGLYQEQVAVDRPLTLVAEPGSARIVGVPGLPVITILGTNDVTIQGLTIVGGETGIEVKESSDVVIDGNQILDSSYRGVDVVSSAATVIRNEIRPAPGPYVIGIRLANATLWPESVISDNVVEHAGGYGIAVNFANATVDGNEVFGGDRAGIAINEMSHADVFGNTVNDAPRYGILVHDMSHAVVTDNVISGAGEPIKLIYHSTADLSGNVTD